MTNSRKFRPTKPAYVVYIDGYASRAGNLREMQAFAKRLRESHKGDVDGRDIRLMRGYINAGGVCITNYSVKPKKYKPSKFMRDLLK